AFKNVFEEKESFYTPLNITEATQVDGIHFNKTLKNLIDRGILETCPPNSRKRNIAIAQNPIGLSKMEWIPVEREQHTAISKWLIIEALIMLVRVHYILKYKKIGGLVSLIKTSLTYIKAYKVPPSASIIELAYAVDKAAMLYPKKTACLPWAGTLMLLALKRKWKCNFIIGIQNLPFYAHAWVESNGEVINDSEELQKRLAPILRIPFEEIKEN
ncbi:MAG: lasso peptide biosynthesis B2 protein, partial [Alphaproteobacteria bacterium]|nr:lasso peptide biosynthesis B2 protein [Alphaproteobacteria bacterium]